MKIRNKGFTLIELLVVVGIVGIMATVVLTFLSSARDNGNNVGVKTNLEGAKKQAELYYLNNASSYGSFTAASCPTSTTAGSIFNDSVVIRAIVKAASVGSGATRCAASGQNYAIAVSFKGSAASWCIDGQGISRQYAGTPTAAISASARCN